MKNEKTDFGFEEVPLKEKEKRVSQVFSSVAPRYDVMNDLMSLGLHRLWKKTTIQMARLQKDQTVLDLAGGTGDLTALISPVISPGKVILADINSDMLQIGRNRLIDKGIFDHVIPIRLNAEELPFPNNFFDRIFIAFGLRNVTHKKVALAEIFRTLKPGGMALILEFSKPILKPLAKIYDIYSFKVLPTLGRLVANDAQSYQYLAESIRKHPDQEALKNMMEQSGFEDCDYHNLSAGIVAIHKGYKY